MPHFKQHILVLIGVLYGPFPLYGTEPLPESIQEEAQKSLSLDEYALKIVWAIIEDDADAARKILSDAEQAGYSRDVLLSKETTLRFPGGFWNRFTPQQLLNEPGRLNFFESQDKVEQ